MKFLINSMRTNKPFALPYADINSACACGDDRSYFFFNHYDLNDSLHITSENPSA